MIRRREISRTYYNTIPIDTAPLVKQQCNTYPCTYSKQTSLLWQSAPTFSWRQPLFTRRTLHSLVRFRLSIYTWRKASHAMLSLSSWDADGIEAAWKCRGRFNWTLLDPDRFLFDTFSGAHAADGSELEKVSLSLEHRSPSREYITVWLYAAVPALGSFFHLQLICTRSLRSNNLRSQDLHFMLGKIAEWCCLCRTERMSRSENCILRWRVVHCMEKGFKNTRKRPWAEHFASQWTNTLH